MSMDLEAQYDKLYRYCYSKTHHRELAEDITQEAFLRWLGADGYRERGQALRYLYTVARHLCIDEYRRKGKPEPLPDDLPAPDTEAAHIARLDLAAALKTLTEDERELILLRYVNGESVGLIAAVTGISRFAVYRKTTAILRRLREQLKEDEP